MPITHHGMLGRQLPGVVYTSPLDIGLNAAIESTPPGQTSKPVGWLEFHSDITPVQWHVSNARVPPGGINSIRYANIAANNYAGAGTNNGTMTTQQFFCPPGFTTYQLSCSVFAAVEGGTIYDVYSILVYSAGLGLLTTIPKSFLGNGGTGGSFSPFVNLISSAVAGRSDIYLQFTFNTNDGSVNATEGVYFDEFYLVFS